MHEPDGIDKDKLRCDIQRKGLNMSYLSRKYSIPYHVFADWLTGRTKTTHPDNIKKVKQMAKEENLELEYIK